MSHLGPILKAARGDRSLRDVAGPAKISASALLRFERGDDVPLRDVLARIAAVLHLHPQDVESLAERDVVERWRMRRPPKGRTTSGPPRGSGRNQHMKPQGGRR